MINFLRKMVQKWLFLYDYDIVIGEFARTPIRAYKNDAGFDLFVSGAIRIAPNARVNIHTNISMKSKIPAWIWLTGRSSTLFKFNLIIIDGIIDGDFTGELFIKAYNPTGKEIYIPQGERIAQIIVIPHTSIRFKRVPAVVGREGLRNWRGLGSTGR